MSKTTKVYLDIKTIRDKNVLLPLKNEAVLMSDAQRIYDYWMNNLIAGRRAPDAECISAADFPSAKDVSERLENMVPARFRILDVAKPMKAPFPARGLRQDWTPAALIEDKGP